MELLPLLLILGLVVYLFRSRLFPVLTASKSSMEALSSAMKIHERVEKNLPPETLHASWGEVYLMEEEAYGTESFREDFLAACVVFDNEGLRVEDREGGLLLAPEPSFELHSGPTEETFFFRLASGLLLLCKDHQPVGSVNGSLRFYSPTSSPALAQWPRVLDR